MPQLELNMEYQSVQRFPAWIALTVFSAITVTAAQSQMPADASPGYKWALAVTIMSLILSFFSCVFYLMARHLFVATPIEIGVAAALLAFWGAGLPVIMNPNRGIAVDAAGVENANLYFGSWVSLAALVYIAGSLIQDITGVTARDVAPAKIVKWYSLAATSIIVMASSVRFYTARQCGNPFMTHEERCKRTKFAISVGVISFIGGCLTAFAVQQGMSLALEFAISSFFLIFWCFGVGFITFGQSPGAIIGNLYFSTWVSFILIVWLFAQALTEFLGGRAGAEGSGTGTSADANGGVTDPSSPEVPAEEDI